MTANRTGRIRLITVEEYLEGIGEGYQSRILTTINRERLVYLPVYPTKADMSGEQLLLANVPSK